MQSPTVCDKPTAYCEVISAPLSIPFRCAVQTNTYVKEKMATLNVDLLGQEILDLTDFFEKTGNRAAAWRAYSLARKHSRPVPDVIQAEVDRFAECVSLVAAKAIQAEVGATPVRFRPEELGQAWRGDGGENPVRALQDEWRDYQIYWSVLTKVENGMKVGAAQAAVAAQPGVGIGIESISKIWKRLRRDG